YGFTGSIDYKFSDYMSIWVRGLYSHFDNFGDRSVITPTINSFTTSPFQGGPDGNMSFNAQIRRPVQVIGSLATGGRREIRTAWFTWEFSAGRSATENHGYSSANFAPIDPKSPLNNVQFGVNLKNPLRVTFDVQNGANIYDYAGYYLTDLDIGRSYSPQLNLQVAMSFNNQYTVAGHYGAFEIGGKVRDTRQINRVLDPVYNTNDPSICPLTGFPVSLQNHDYYGGSYTAPPLMDYNKILAAVNGNVSAFSIDNQIKRAYRNNFDLGERIGAGYIMNTINFNRWRLYTGLRFETTTENVFGYQSLTDANG